MICGCLAQVVASYYAQRPFITGDLFRHRGGGLNRWYINYCYLLVITYWNTGKYDGINTE